VGGAHVSCTVYGKVQPNLAIMVRSKGWGRGRVKVMTDGRMW